MDYNINTSDLDKLEIKKETPRIIKVVGVGGGGGNAVSHMFEQGIQDVSFVLCNTDNQALEKSNIPTKIQLGIEVTKGLGAGNKPQKAKEAAEESREEIKKEFNDGTQMIFITAGMGGGTGTGAAPIIAGIAKEMGILTVGIVTIPFLFEGEKKIIQALDGVEELSKNVDALLVINNERLREIYADLTIKNAFEKADDTLTIAAKSIAEIITLEGFINLDFADVQTILKDGGVAIMSTGTAKGDNRIDRAIKDALHSPLLNNNDVYKAKKIMLSFYCNHKAKIDEMDGIDRFMGQFTDRDIEVIWGIYYLDNLEEEVKVTILATGFGVDSIPGYTDSKSKQLTEEEEARIHKEEVERKRNEQRIFKVYGESAQRHQNARTYKKNNIFIFSDEALEDETVISKVEDSPTYDRTPSKLRSLQNITSGSYLNNSDDDSIETTPPPMENKSGKNIISF